MSVHKHAGKSRRRWWTVMLLYPDYLTDDHGEDIFVEWALTAEPDDAVPVVQRKAVEAQRDLSVKSAVDIDIADFKMIAVWAGRSTLALDASSYLKEPQGADAQHNARHRKETLTYELRNQL